MSRLYNFAILGRGRLGNGLLQTMFDGCENVFVPGFVFSDQAEGTAQLSSLVPGNPGSGLAPWPWIARTGLLVHGPVWRDRLGEVLPAVTTRELLVQMVREPRAHITASYRHDVRTQVTTRLLYGQTPPDDANWLNRLADLDRFLGEQSHFCRYHALAAGFAAAFRRHMVVDFADIMPDRIDTFIGTLFAAIGTQFTGGMAPLRRIDRTLPLHYMTHSQRRIDVYGVSLDVIIAYAGEPDPNRTHLFDHELARVEHEDAVRGRSPAIELEAKPLALRTSASRYLSLPLRLRRRIEAENLFGRLFREQMLPEWLAKSELAERTAGMVIKRADLAYLERRILAVEAADLEMFLNHHPELRATWGL